MMVHPSDDSDCQLGMFAKYWQPGVVKTRLAADVGPKAASSVHRECVRVLLQRLTQIDCGRHVLAFSPDDRHEAFVELAGPQWILEPQVEGDLGVRMSAYFEHAFQSGARRVVLLGSDSPTLPLEIIGRAFDLLDRFPVVLGPSEDGGYYLVGASGGVPNIFNAVDWSTSGVWSQTLERLREHRTPFGELAAWYDVDVLDDLRRLYAELSSNLCNDKLFSLLRDEVRQALSMELK